MLPYWLLLIYFAILALAIAPTRSIGGDGTVYLAEREPVFIMILSLFVVTLMIGLRFQVGGDWAAYKIYLLTSETMSIGDALTMSDPGYWIVNVISTSMGWEIAGVNLICGFIFTLGLIRYCQTMPRPWLAMVIAVPYMIIVVGMGYTRQSVALGFIMLGLSSLANQRIFRYVALCLAGSLFHMTSIIMIPIAGLLYTNNRLIIFGLVGILSIIGYFTLLQDNINDLIQAYVVDDYQSSGALIRLSLNVVPAALFLFYRDRFDVTPTEKQVLTIFSWAAIGLMFLFFVTNISTAIDRMALYIMPLQLAVLSRLPEVLFPDRQQRQLAVFGLVGYSALIMIVWLNFASHAIAWLPYKTLFDVWGQ